MAHYHENPRTNKYSKVKLILIRIELLLKKGFLFVLLMDFFLLLIALNYYISIIVQQLLNQVDQLMIKKLLIKQINIKYHYIL